MKNKILILALFILASTVSINCSKNNEVKDFTDLASKVDTANLTYTLYPTAANCQAYKTAINNFINCPAVSAQDKATLQLTLTQLIC